MMDHHRHNQEVEEGYEIEPGISFLHTPGHSAGSMAVMVETDDGLCAVTGDVMHFASVAITKQSPLIFWNEADARKSIERVLERADNLYPGHDRPFRLVKGEIEYLTPPEMTIGGVTPDIPGIEEQTLERLG